MFPVIWYFLFGSLFGQSGGRVSVNGYQGESDASTPLQAASMFSNLENIEFPVSATSPKSQLGSLVSSVKGLLHGSVPISRKKKRCSHCERCTRAKAKDRVQRWRRRALPIALVVRC